MKIFVAINTITNKKEDKIMQNQHTLQQLRALKLTGMADAFEQQQDQPSTHDELSFD